MPARNLTMLTDLYQLTMMYGYHKDGKASQNAVFDLFFRPIPQKLSYAVAAGLEQVLEYIERLRFDDDDIEYLRSLKLFDEDFLTGVLRGFRFTGDIYAMPEGEIVFANEPLLRVHAPILEAQLIETALLNIVNHQTLIATKASRIVTAAQGDSVLEFGLRRAQGPDAGLYGARAAIIGGCDATSNVLAGQLFDVPAKGTHAHSWIMSFDDELSAFRAYAKAFPTSCLLLVDTYNTLKSGVPNAITVFKELRETGYEPVGIRLDSGDIAYLSKTARAMLDDSGFEGVKIFASNDLDEHTIWDIKAQGACVDVWGVGTRLITGDGQSALGGVYKLSALGSDGQFTPKMKISDNMEKTTNPGIKTVYRIYDGDGFAIADLIALREERYDERESLTIFDPMEPWKRMTLNDYKLRELLVPAVLSGKRVSAPRALEDLREFSKKELGTFYPEYKRLNLPHIYKVDLSKPLFDLRHSILAT